MPTHFIIRPGALLPLLLCLSPLFASNVEIEIRNKGGTEVNKCNMELMHSFNEDIDAKEKRRADFADEELLKICPNNKYTCCSREEMQPMLERFKYTRDLLMFKNQMLEKLLLYFNSVAKESFEKFIENFSPAEIKCTGEKEYGKLTTYYMYIQEFSSDVMEMVNRTTAQILSLYSSFICTVCSPFNHSMYQWDETHNRPSIHINKRTCQNIIEISLERKNLVFIWNRLNKIINAIKCKKDLTNSKVKDFESYSAIELRYYSHEECYQKDENFIEKDECIELCKSELKFFSFDDYRLYRVKTAIEELQNTFEMRLSKDNLRLTDKLMEDEEERHPNSEVKSYIDKINSILDRYYFLRQVPGTKFHLENSEVVISKYSGLISNSYEMNMIFFNRVSVVGAMVVNVLLLFFVKR